MGVAFKAFDISRCELARTKTIWAEGEMQRQWKSEVKRKKEKGRRVGRGELGS